MTNFVRALLFTGTLLYLPSMFLSFKKTNITCSEGQYLCKDDGVTCIYNHEVCNGVKDCAAGDDEANCRQCPNRNDFRCKNGRCILPSWKCDRRNDCGDNSDEDGCPVLTSCAKDQFLCGDGMCIAKLWKCDGENDCSDSSDEADCHSTSCDPGQLRCDSGQCIPASWVCDGSPDCIDITDEKNCTKEVKTCSSEEFRCAYGSCIDKALVCDQRKDCEDGSDEKNCSQTNIACPEGLYLCKDGVTCIYQHEVCDRYRDCPTGDDEVNCRYSVPDCQNGEFLCVNISRCISKHLICDGDDDCGDGADENPANCSWKAKPISIPTRKSADCEEYSCGFSGECIPWSSVCDDMVNCADSTDEGGLCSNACQDDSGGCSQMCQKTPDGSKCVCYSGYSLSDDGKTCEDVNECEIPGSCSHYCNNTMGGFKCDCDDGYYLEPGLKKCKAIDEAATFIYLLPEQINGFDLRTRVKRVYTKEVGRDIRGMDYDASESLFLWSDGKKKTINIFALDTHENDVLLTTPFAPTHLRWDWIGKNFYYTDEEGSINCCNKNGKYCTTVIQNAALYINSIDISPNTGFMFWTVWSTVLKRNAGVVERADLDGSHRRAIVSDRNEWPTTVTVDHIQEMVYWTDAKLNLMECSDFHGRKRRTVVSEGMYYPFSMTMFEDYVYWFDWGTDKFIRCHKFDGRNCSLVMMGEAKAEVVMVIHKAMQPKGVNRCGAARCSQLCIPTPLSYVCKCGSGYLEKNSACELKSTASPVVATSPSCPTGYCANNAPCAVISHNNYQCMCSHPFKGTRCEITIIPRHSSFDYSWFFVGLSMAVLFIYFIFF